ncbi:MAG: GWxTD domain-containing protein [Candidatus Marinimicrobia bacterium]|nr:GWxTD domain-containing protein [Candidatus Neomarinimicrobiota bacterium]
MGKRGDGNLASLTLTVIRSPVSHPDSIQVSIYTKIALDQLVFVRYDDKFRARYEISIFAIDEDERVRGTLIREGEVIEAKFKDTKSSEQYYYFSANMVLPTGKYEIVTHLVDLDNRRRHTARSELESVSYPSDKLALGDVMLVSEVEGEPGGAPRVTPLTRNEITDDVDSVYLYLVIRNPYPESILAPLEYKLNQDKEVIATLHDTLSLTSAITSHLIPLDTRELKARDYTITVRVQADSQEVEQTIPVLIVRTGLSSLIEDIDTAIEQARYVASGRQIKEMRKTDEEEKEEVFLAFWAALDPTPATPKNELMDEYYGRVAYANAHFRSYGSGWKTDMGMVFIIYGPPDDIERHPWDINRKPYEIWTYFEKGSRRFVFVDLNLFGDYRLITPLYPNR